MEEQDEQPTPKPGFRIKVDLSDVLQHCSSTCKHSVVWYFVDTSKCDTLGAVKSAILETFKVDVKAEFVEVTLDDCAVPDDTTAMFLNVGDILVLRYTHDDTSTMPDVGHLKQEKTGTKPDKEVLIKDEKMIPEEEDKTEAMLLNVAGDEQQEQGAPTMNTETGVEQEDDNSGVALKQSCSDDEMPAIEPVAECSKGEDVVKTVISKIVSKISEKSFGKKKKPLSVGKQLKQRKKLIRNLLRKQEKGQDVIWPAPTREVSDLLLWDVLDETEDSGCEEAEREEDDQPQNGMQTSDNVEPKSGPSTASKGGRAKSAALANKKNKKANKKNSPSRQRYKMARNQLRAQNRGALLQKPPPFLAQLPKRGNYGTSYKGNRQAGGSWQPPDLMTIPRPGGTSHYSDFGPARAGRFAELQSEDWLDAPRDPYFERDPDYRLSDEPPYFEEEDPGFRGDRFNDELYSKEDSYYYSASDGSYWCPEPMQHQQQYVPNDQPSRAWNSGLHGPRCGGLNNDRYAAGSSFYAARGNVNQRFKKKKKNKKKKPNAGQRQGTFIAGTKPPLKGILKKSSATAAAAVAGPEDVPIDQADEIVEEFVQEAPARDFSIYEHLKRPPQMNDVIAYKIFERAENGNSEVSKYRVGRVLSYDSEGQEVVLDCSESGGSGFKDREVILDVGCFVDARLVTA